MEKCGQRVVHANSQDASSHLNREALVLADDLTGALEAGALYAAAGIRSAVELSRNPMLDGQPSAMVLDLELRHKSNEQAQTIVSEVIRDARVIRFRRIYLKIDSTLRGPIAGEIAGVFQAWPECRVVLAPAYPKMGRTVCNGLVYVNGHPLSETVFARDPLNPIHTSSVGAQLSNLLYFYATTATELRSALIEGAPNSVIICDALNQSHIAAVASTIAAYNGPCVCAGSSGLLEELIRCEHGVAAETGLIVNGSLNQVSRDQCTSASTEIPLLKLADENADEMLIQSTLTALKAHRWAILSSGSRIEDCDATAHRLAHVAAAVTTASAIDSLVVFGGDTAAAILRRLRIQTIYPVRELLPGMPASRIAFQNRKIVLITKAGGFGDLDVILQIRNALSH